MNRLVYLAGPVSKDPWGCVQQAKPWFHACRRHDLVPIAPQWGIVAEIAGYDLTYKDWMAYDLRLIDHCAGLIRLPGDSPGADREVEHANKLGIPVEIVEAWSWPSQTVRQLATRIEEASRG